MKKLIYLYIIAATLSACIQTKEKLSPLSYQQALGTYEGIMPCSDCSGVFTHLELLDSVTFLKETRYVGKSRKIFHSRGNWKIVNDTTLSTLASGVQEFYTYKKGKLLLQNKEGKNIETASLMQKVSQRSGATNKDYILEASGENASWRLLANAEKLIFVSEDGDTLRFIKPIIELNESNFTIEASIDNQVIKVLLSPLGCINQNQQYQTYHAQIEWKGNQYKGCGEVNDTNLLHGKWVAEDIIGWAFPKESKQEQTPYLHFNPFTKSVTGFTGCNRFSATFMQQDYELRFSALLSTKMYCNGSAENFFMQALSRANSFEMQHDILTIKEDGNILMVLHAE